MRALKWKDLVQKHVEMSRGLKISGFIFPNQKKIQQNFIDIEIWWKGLVFLRDSDNHFPSKSLSPHSREIEQSHMTIMVVVIKETVWVGYRL